MTRNPSLHRAPLGYGKDGPLTWVAECRVPRESPSPARLAMATWMLEHGSDVHQGGDGPLMRAALNAYRIPMMELLVSHGADVNALWHGYFPIIFAPCESLDPGALKWLLDHGANPNCRDHGYTINGHRISRHGSRLHHRVVCPVSRTTEHLYRDPSRGRRCDEIRRASGACICSAVGSIVWPSRLTPIPHS